MKDDKIVLYMHAEAATTAARRLSTVFAGCFPNLAILMTNPPEGG